MLAFAAIVPHSLDLLRTPKKVPTTINALAILQASLKKAKPDVVIIFSPHGRTTKNAYTINLSEQYTIDLLDQGIKTPAYTFASDPLTVMEIRRKHETDQTTPVVLATTPLLDYGAAVPLLFLKPARDTAVIPITASTHESEKHFAFGTTIKSAIMKSAKRFAVIASLSLNNNATNLTPFFSSPSISLDELKKSVKKIDTFSSCGVASLALLMGILDNLPWTFVPVSQETVGTRTFVVATFSLEK